MTEENSPHKRAFFATTAIMGSRIFGLVREQAFAFLFGAGAVFDAYIVAFRIPNLLRDLLAEGALSQSFIAVFSKKLGKGETKEALQLAAKTHTFMQVFIGFICVLGIVFAPFLVRALAGSFTGDKFDLTVSLTRLMMPFILFVALAALVMGILNAYNHYFIPHSASTAFNVVSVTSGLLCIWLFAPEYFWAVWHNDVAKMHDMALARSAIFAMAIGTLLGGLSQYWIQLPILWREGIRLRFDFNWKDSALWDVLKLTGPAILGGAAVQINVLINTQFASSLGDGAVSWLNYAFRFMQLPLGIFGVAIASASAPTFARLFAEEDFSEMRRSMQSSIRLCLFLCVPATFAFLLLGRPIVTLIYQHGHFSDFDTQMTTHALVAYSFAITAYSLIKIYQPAFLAFGNSKTPMRISLLSIAINVIVNGVFLFVCDFGHWSLAMGTSIVATINFLLLSMTFRKHLVGVWDAANYKIFGKILAAAFLSLALTFLVLEFLITHEVTNSAIWDSFKILVVCGLVFGLSYLGFCGLFGVDEVQMLLHKIRKPKRH